ncbi:maltose ABC transporter periplasmic protein [compost metagenome]
MKDYSDNDIVLDLNGFLRQDNVDQEETFFNFLLDMSTYNGKLTGIPIAPEVWFIVYNEKRFQDAGIPEPSENWTWEELADAGKRLKAAYGGQSIYNPIMLPFDAFTLENLIASNGGSILSDDGQTAQGYLNSDASVQAVEWVVDLVVKDQLAKPSTLQDLVNLFANTNKALLNQSSIYIVPTSFKSFIPADKGFKIASLPYFANGERVNIPNMMSFGISSKSKYPEVAWDFLKELTFNDTEITRSMVKYNLNSTKTIIGQFMDDPIIKTSYREFEYARIGSMYKNRNFLSANRNKISPALRDLIYSANNGENVNVKESLSEIARDIEADLKEEEYIPFQ